MRPMHRMQMTHKKYIFCIILLIVFLLAVQPVLAVKSKPKAKAKPQPKPKPPVMLTYNDTKYKIAVNYPAAWYNVPGFKQTL
ncbi:MAG: hypothetical protein ACM3PP_14085 [Candidatus Saccharibacteria bacterium]